MTHISNDNNDDINVDNKITNLKIEATICISFVGDKYSI